MKKATFTVETISAGMGEVLVYVEDPAGHREEVCDPSLCVTSTFSFVHFKNDCVCVQAKVTANNDKNRTYSVVYVPKVTGMHKVSEEFNVKDVRNNP